MVSVLSIMKTKIMTKIPININTKIIKTTKILNKFLSKCPTLIHKLNVPSSVFPTLLSNKLLTLPMSSKLKSIVKLQESLKDKLIKSMEVVGMLLWVKTLELMSPMKEVLLCILLLTICTFVYSAQDDFRKFYFSEHHEKLWHICRISLTYFRISLTYL